MAAEAGPIAILAGSDQLPVLLSDRLRRDGRDHRILAFRGFAAPETRSRADAIVDLLDVRRTQSIIEGWRPSIVILAGAVRRPQPSAFLNTFSALLAGAKYGVTPSLVAVRKYATNDIDPDKSMEGQLEPFYKGQFIANVDSGINSFADLKGKTFCFVDPNSTSGYIVPRIILAANGINPDTDFAATQNAGSHPNVAVAVYKGDCDAGVTFINVLTDAAADLQGTYPDITDKVKVFAVTDPIPNDGMQFIKSLDPNLKKVIVEGMMAMANDPGGKAVLKSLYNYDAFQEVDPTFYNDFLAVLQKAGVDPSSLVK